MNKKVEVSYNPQLGYLKTIFTHNFDFLTGVLGYTDRGDGVEVEAGTYRNKTAKVIIRPVSAAAYRFQMYPYGKEPAAANEVFSMEQTVPYQVEETEEYLSVRTLRMEIRIKKTTLGGKHISGRQTAYEGTDQRLQCGQYVQVSSHRL